MVETPNNKNHMRLDISLRKSMVKRAFFIFALWLVVIFVLYMTFPRHLHTILGKLRDKKGKMQNPLSQATTPEPSSPSASVVLPASQDPKPSGDATSSNDDIKSPETIEAVKKEINDLGTSTPVESPIESSAKSLVILISISGLRLEDIVSNSQMKAFLGIIKDLPVIDLNHSMPFTEITSHYSMVTGKKPWEHGIVNSSFFSDTTVFNANDEMSLKNPAWWLAEPIWNTLTFDRRKTLHYNWPGADTKIYGVNPPTELSGNTPLDVSSSLIKAIPDPMDPKLDVSLVLLNFDSYSTAINAHGYYSKEALDELNLLDETLAKIKEHFSDTNMIFTSNIRYAPIYNREASLIPIGNLVNTSDLTFFSTGTVSLITPVEGQLDSVYTKIKENIDNNNYSGVTVYKKETLVAPASNLYAYGDSPRISPLVVVATNRYIYDEQVRDSTLPMVIPSISPGFVIIKSNQTQPDKIFDIYPESIYDIIVSLINREDTKKATSFH